MRIEVSCKYIVRRTKSNTMKTPHLVVPDKSSTGLNRARPESMDGKETDSIKSGGNVGGTAMGVAGVGGGGTLPAVSQPIGKRIVSRRRVL
jgi:hypothetical protein